MYTKQASTLISNWLLRNKCDFYTISSTSESKYLKYGDTSIRISQHMPTSVSPNSIYIMIPVNNRHSFGVFIGKQFCSVQSMKELKSFLKSIFLVLDIKAFNELAKVQVKTVQIRNGIDVNLASDITISKLNDQIAEYKQKINEQKLKIQRQTAELGHLHTLIASNKK